MRFILWLCLLIQVSAFAGNEINVLLGENRQELSHYEVLPDKGYRLSQVIKDTNLPFLKNGDLLTENGTVFWLRIELKSSFQEAYLALYPATDFELFSLKADGKTWISSKNGFYISAHRRDLRVPVSLKIGATNTLYIRLKLHELSAKTKRIEPQLSLYKATYVNDQEEYIYLAWFVTSILILLFFVNIIIDYLMHREQTHLYYILILAGGFLYGTSFHKLFNLFLDWRLLRFHFTESGLLYHYDLNNLINELSILMVVIGYIQLTRKFLRTAENLPKWNQLLKNFLWLYVGLEGINLSVLLFTELFFANWFNLFINGFLIVMVILIFTTGVKSLKSGTQNSKLFLIANSIPLTTILVSAIYLNLVYYEAYNMVLLPYLGILSFSLTFSIALIIRNRFVQSEIEAKKMEVLLMKNEQERIRLEHDLVTAKSREMMAELALEKSESEMLKLKMIMQERELLSSNLNVTQKNEVLQKLKKEIELLAETGSTSQKEQLGNIKSIFHNIQMVDANWESFKLYFEKVHPHFFEKLEAEHPDLTPNEIRLSAYLQLNLSNKEIAALQNINPASVKRAKIRLKHKMNKEG